MLLESTMAMIYKKKRENFAEEAKTTPVVTTWYDFLYMIFAIVWIVIFFALWLRIVYFAFTCNVGEGVASIFFSSLYGLYKFGDLIKMSCNTAA